MQMNRAVDGADSRGDDKNMRKFTGLALCAALMATASIGPLMAQDVPEGDWPL